MDHWQYQYLEIVLELLVPRRTVKTGNKNKKTDNHPWKASFKGRHRSPACPRKEGGKELLKLEEAHIVEITKLKEYVDSKEHPLIQIVRMYQHTTHSALLQTARSLKTELQRGTRQLKDGAAQNTKDGEERGCMDSSHVTEMKNWWIMNSHIVG